MDVEPGATAPRDDWSLKWMAYAKVVRRCVLLCAAAVLTLVAVASGTNPWNFTVLKTAICHPVTMGSFATIALGAELCVTFKGFLIRTFVGGSIAGAVIVLFAVPVVSSLWEPARHHGPKVATTPDGHINAIVHESDGGYLGLRRDEVYLQTSEGLDRETRVAYGCLRTPATDVRFIGNRTIQLHDENGEFHLVTFDKSLNVDAQAHLPCTEPYNADD